MELPEALVTAVKQRQVVLFAGAGLSSHLGLPLFDVLKSYLGEQLRLRNAEQLEFPALAEYYLLQKKDPDELWCWLQQTFQPDGIDIRGSEPHRCIVELDFPVIYTTNYDRWIEASFLKAGKTFRTVVTVSDLAGVAEGETEIIKFHGDLEHPESIVLTESTFLRRMSLDEPLDIRLRSDSLARPILFVGYSMSDPNIRYLLFKLQQLWEESSGRSQRPASYLLMAQENPVEECLLRRRGVEPIFMPGGDINLGLTCFFRSLLAMARRNTGNENVSSP